MKRLLGRLTLLFPEAFRDRFGAEMAAQVAHDFDGARRRGRWAAFSFTVATGYDLVAAALADRWHPTWRGPGAATEGRRMRWLLNEWVRDLRHAGRTLRRSPGFTVMVVGTLGLAIGVTAGMFTVVDKVLLDPLPYANADRLVYIGASAPGSDFPPEFGVASEFYLQYREQSRLLEDVSTYNGGTSTLRTPDRVERIRMSWPTYTLFTTLGARPILGRLPVEEDGNQVALISYALWTSWFGGDSAVIGRAYDISGATRTVIGVMGPEFRFPSDGTMLWIPQVIRAEGLRPGRFGVSLVARAVPGATPAAVANELNTLARGLPERFGASANYARLIEQHRAIVRPLRDQLLGSVARPLWVLLGAVGIVLLIACANVANLFAVRAEGRQRDFAVRRAIGAARRQLIRLQMAEAVLVAAFAAPLAVTLAALALPAFLRAAPPGIPGLDQVGIGGATVLATLLAAALSAIACGVVPAVRASAPDFIRLRESGRGATRRRTWARDGLVVGQTALALVLLIGSGLLVRSFWQLRHVDPGYDTRDVFTFQIAPEQPTLTDGPSFARFDLAFLDRLAQLPGVQSVGLVENVPLNESVASQRFRTEEVSDNPGILMSYTFAAGDYFKTMGIRVLEGRPLDADDQLSWRGNVVISRTAANQLWPGQSAVGRRFYSPGDSAWLTVAAVVADVMQDSFRDAPLALIYYPLVGPAPRSWWVSSPAYVVKTTRAEAIAPEVRALAREVAPEAPMYRIFTMAGLARDSMVQLSFTMLTLGIASGLALLLGALGLYGVLSYLVAERTREIGVRMALGAEAARVRRMVVAQGARVVAVGVVIGIGVAIASTRALGSLLFGVPAVDAGTFAGMSASMVVIGLLASYVPARRASSVDPIESLRGE